MLTNLVINFAAGSIVGLRCQSLVLFLIAIVEIAAIWIGGIIEPNQLTTAIPSALAGACCLQAGYCLTTFGPIFYQRAWSPLLTPSRSRRHR